MDQRFFPLSDVSEMLGITASQTYALVRCGDLAAIKVGGRGQWRVENRVLDAFIDQMYADTRSFVESHPYAQAVA